MSFGALPNFLTGTMNADVDVKLRGVYRSSYDDAYIAWVHATEEG